MRRLFFSEFHKDPRFEDPDDYEINLQGKHTGCVEDLRGDLYAILWNAKHESPFDDDIANAYHQLESKGIPNNRIAIMEGDSGKKDFRYSPRFPSRKESIVSAIEYLQRQGMSERDRFLWYGTNHGTRWMGESWFTANAGRKISESGLAEIFEDVPMNFGVFCFTHCYSGGLAERFGYGNRIGISSTTKYSVAYTGHKENPSHLKNLFHFSIIDELLDANNTIESAFVNAAKRDPLREMPQLFWENADPSLLKLMR